MEASNRLITVALRPSQYITAKALADASRRSVGYVVREALDAYLAGLGAEPVASVVTTLAHEEAPAAR